MWTFVLCFVFGMAFVFLHLDRNASPFLKKYAFVAFPVVVLGSAMLVEPKAADRLAILTLFNMLFVFVGIIVAVVVGLIFNRRGKTPRTNTPR